jgi:hypothetical protein
MDKVEFMPFNGKVIEKITGAHKGSKEIIFLLEGGQVWRMYHRQDCCEQVTVADVDGDVADLIGFPCDGEIASRTATKEEICDSGTWTFYKFKSPNGYVTIRWLGESNGYYSESVDVEEVLP